MQSLTSPSYVEEKPLLRGHSHQAMFFVSIGACVPLIFRAHTSLEMVAMIVYTFGVLAMFGMSALYHRVNWSLPKESIFQKLDHACIFIMIAGCFTPVALLGLSEDSARTLLYTIWGVAVLGIFQSMFFVNIPNYLTASLYLVAGYIFVPYLPEIRGSLGAANFGLIIAGGVSYTIGAVVYGLRKPMLWPKYFGYHEVFHVFVNIGAILHYIVISSLIGF